MASSTKKIKPVVKVQLIIYACPNCGNEIEEVKLCPMCSHPMRVVEVKELYGDEAEKLLEEIKENKSVTSTITDEGMEVDKSSLKDEDTDDIYLSDIYADDGSEPKNVPPLDTSILDDFDDDGDDDLPPLPEL